jgi:hypothetical protein
MFPTYIFFMFCVSCKIGNATKNEYPVVVESVTVLVFLQNNYFIRS